MVNSTRAKKQKTSVQSMSQPTSPVTRSSATLNTLPVVVGGSNPEVSQAVRVMEAEMTVMEQLCDRVDSLITTRMEQIQKDAERFLQRTADELSKRISKAEQRYRGGQLAGEASELRSDENPAVPESVVPQEVMSESEPNTSGAASQGNHGRGGQAVGRNDGVLSPNESPTGNSQANDAVIALLQRRLAALEGELQEERSLRRRAEQRLSNPNLSNGRLSQSFLEPPLVSQSQRPHEPVTRSPPTTTPDQNVSYIMTRETVPHFKGEAPASEPLRKNQEVESWIRAIENIVRPSTNDSFIRSARASCRGRAEAIINSECFDHIEDWCNFKQELRRKFRGTYSAADFFKVLYDQTMGENQAPMDYFLQIEGSVYQGCRDHREAIGEPSELIRRVFLSGIPFWMKDFLALKESCSAMQLAETAQRLWNNRHGIKHGGPTISHQPSHNDYNWRRQHEEPRYTRRDRVAAPVAAIGRPLSPQSPPNQDVWCEYHRSSGHNTRQCIALGNAQGPRHFQGTICYRCRQEGHLARDCLFPPGQGGRVPSPSGIRNPRDNGHERRHTNVSDPGISSECTGVAGATSRGTQY